MFKEINRHFLQEHMRIASERVKSCVAHVIRDLQIKTTMQYQVTPIKMMTFQSNYIKFYQGSGGTGTLIYGQWVRLVLLF